MGVSDDDIAVVAGSLDVESAKFEKCFYESASFYRDVLNLIIVKTRYLPMEKSHLFNIYYPAIGQNPDIKIVVGPFNKENQPKRQKPAKGIISIDK